MQSLNEWHGWFAWYPVECEGIQVWLEHIQRRWWPTGGWQYRFFITPDYVVSV